MARAGIGTWTRPSSRGDRTYTITLWNDGTSSCDCPGWRFQRKGQERTCKHVREPALAAEMREVYTEAMRQRAAEQRSDAMAGALERTRAREAERLARERAQAQRPAAFMRRAGGPQGTLPASARTQGQALTTWVLASERSGKTYQITLWAGVADFVSCTCPDWMYRRQGTPYWCKHITGLRAEIDAARAESQRRRDGRPAPSVATPAQVERINRLLSRDRPPDSPTVATPPPPALPTRRPRRAIRLEDDE